MEDVAGEASTEVAALIAYALGALSAMHGLLPDAMRHLLVGAIAALALTLLALKKPLHGFAARISEDDLYATAKFVSLALIVLPALPRETYGPLDVLTPFKIGKMIVLIAGISFAGYIAARVVGAARGLLVAGLLGGLVSSTAVTLTYAGRARTEPPLAALCAVAITVACSMMFARVLVVVGSCRIVHGSWERQESSGGEEVWRLRLTHEIGHFGTVSFPASLLTRQARDGFVRLEACCRLPP